MSIWVCGEVLIDLFPGDIPVVGGGPANTAKALALLGHDVQFIEGISTDKYGQLAREELLFDGVDLSLSHSSDLPTAIAKVTLQEDGSARYKFSLENTATFDFNASWLPEPEKHKPSVLQVGTLATIVEPGATVLYNWALKVKDFAPIVFDPNVRPSVLGDRTKYIELVEKWVAISAVVKLSDEDLEWLYPGQRYETVADRWIENGCVLVIVTCGVNGLVGFTKAGSQRVLGEPVDVVDTIGAGDTVGAIVIDEILEKGILALDGEILKAMLHRAAVAASITCSRAGAQPPCAHELKRKLRG